MRTRLPDVRRGGAPRGVVGYEIWLLEVARYCQVQRSPVRHTTANIPTRAIVSFEHADGRTTTQAGSHGSRVAPAPVSVSGLQGDCDLASYVDTAGTQRRAVGSDVVGMDGADQGFVVRER